MAWFASRRDPLRDQERELTQRLAELQSQIAVLNNQIQQEQAQPKLRSTAQPHGPSGATAGPQPTTEPAFESVSHQRVTHPLQPGAAPATHQALGVGRPSWLTLLHRWWDRIRGAPTRNPTLVRYLAAGNVQGLRPLRYEKRVARNRFFMLLTAFLLILYGLLYWYRRFL
jgi:hypothetical protein